MWGDVMDDDLDFQTWEMLSAYLDGALDGIGRAAVERTVRNDPEVASALVKLRQQNDALKRWAAEVDTRPMPLGIRAMLGHSLGAVV